MAVGWFDRLLGRTEQPVSAAALEKASLASQAVKVTQITDADRALVDASQSVFGPGTPPQPAHPEDLEPRRWDYQPGYNIANLRPRAYESISFELLRNLTNNYDIARLCIEYRKDEQRGLKWHIAPRAVTGMTRAEGKVRRQQLEPAINQVTGFLLTPNAEDDFSKWLGQYLDDVLTIDAATLFKRRNRGGGLHALEVVDGATIRPIIDSWGRRPDPPAPAYGQVIRGQTWQLFTADEISYQPYWQRSTSPYGSPPMEWVLIAVNRALRRQTLDMSKYTEGTLPIGFYKVPETWSTAQIQELQGIMDELLAGNDLARSRIRFVPGGPNTGLEVLNPEPKPEVEQWLAVLTCAAYAVPPMGIGLPPMRAGLGGEGLFLAQEDTERRRAKKPLAMHVKGVLDGVIADELGQPELEIVFEGLEDEDDQVKQAQADAIYWGIGKISTDELRERDDLDPLGLGPLIAFAGTAPMLVSDFLKASIAAASAPQPPLAGPPGAEPNGGPGPAPQTPSADPADVTADGASTVAKASGDLERWQRKALKAVRDGRDPARFDSDAIPAEQQALLKRSLAGAADAEAVRSAFTLAKAGASAGPFLPLVPEMRARLLSAVSSPSGSESRGAPSPGASA